MSENSFRICYAIPGKKRKTRSGSHGRPAAQLPDISNYYTNGDIISAVSQALLADKKLTPYDAALLVKDMLIRKLRQLNPRLALIEATSVSNNVA